MISKFPHCDSAVLHAPGLCEYCDMYPEWQALRKSWGINFTGESDPNKLACPAESRRDLSKIEMWGGNRASRPSTPRREPLLPPEPGNSETPTEPEVGPKSYAYRVTLSGKPADPTYDGPAPQPIEPETGMHGDYYVLSPEERAKGWKRPYRDSYIHETCKTRTKMGRAIAETYAREPHFYTGTFCAGCRAHFPVGRDGEFVWADSKEKVGT